MMYAEVIDTVTKSSLSLHNASDIGEPTTGWLNRNRNGRGGLLRCCESYVASQGQHCPNGRHCTNAHVDPSLVMAHRREVQQWLVEKENEFLAEREHVVYKVFIPEVNEVCDVPVRSLSFTRGLYVPPEQRAKRGKGSGVISSLAATSCKLFAQNPYRCSWGKLCNQAHVHGRWLSQHCAAVQRWFAQAEQDLALQCQTGALETIVVHDPTRRRTLRVPTQYIAETTRGLITHLQEERTEGRLPSLCMLYASRHCTAGQRCNQVHICRDYLEQIGSAPPTQPRALPATPSMPLSPSDLGAPSMPEEEDEKTLLESCFVRALDFGPSLGDGNSPKKTQLPSAPVSPPFLKEHDVEKENMHPSPPRQGTSNIVYESFKEMLS